MRLCKRKNTPNPKRRKYVEPVPEPPYTLEDLDNAANKEEYMAMMKKNAEVKYRNYPPRLVGPRGAKRVVYRRAPPIPEDSWELHQRDKKAREAYKKKRQMFCDSRGITSTPIWMRITDFSRWPSPVSSDDEIELDFCPSPTPEEPEGQPSGKIIDIPYFSWPSPVSSDDETELDFCASPTPEEPEGQPSGEILEIEGQPSLKSSSSPLHPTDVDIEGGRRIEHSPLISHDMETDGNPRFEGRPLDPFDVGIGGKPGLDIASPTPVDVGYLGNVGMKPVVEGLSFDSQIVGTSLEEATVVEIAEERMQDQKRKSKVEKKKLGHVKPVVGGLSSDPQIVGTSLEEEAVVVENAEEKMQDQKRKSKMKKKKVGHMKVSGELAVLLKRVIRKEFKTLKKDLLQIIKESTSHI